METKQQFKEQITFKSSNSRIEDVTEKGTVAFWFAVHNVQDAYNHVGNQGMFQKSINERMAKIMHYKNHNSTLMPGVIQEIQDLPYGGRAVSKLILDTQIGKETYAEYKAMAEAGKSMPHSYHFDFVNPTEDEAFNAFIKGKELQLKEVKLYEVSTLTKRPVNELATMQSLKSFEELDLNELLTEDRFFKALLNCEFTDAKLENLQTVKSRIEALIESRLKSTQTDKPFFVGFNDYLQTKQSI